MLVTGKDDAELAVKLWIASSGMNWFHSGVVSWARFVLFTLCLTTRW
jgi:hypothetical protein